MKDARVGNMLLLMICYLLSSGLEAYATIAYDHNYIAECLKTPPKPQYGGGMVVNPEFNQDLKGWRSYGNSKMRLGQSPDGNKFISTCGRKLVIDSVGQPFQLQNGMLYVFSAWLQVDKKDAFIEAVYKFKNEIKPAGWVVAKEGCWTMLKGGITANSTGTFDLYFRTNNTDVQIMVDSVSLQPFTPEEWKFLQYRSTEKVRKGQVQFEVVDEQDQPVPGAKISVKQTKQDFPFGNAITKYILNNTAYQDWFTSRFKYTVFENEMKWYEKWFIPDKENYTIPDAMLNFSRTHEIKVRGHNVLWDDYTKTPTWLVRLNDTYFREYTYKRINQIVGRYKGQLFHWDVINENLHFHYYEDRMGANASAEFLKMAHEIDKDAIPFLNDFNMIEEPKDHTVSAVRYLDLVKKIREQGYGGPLGLGLEGHFRYPMLPYVRTTLDVLASANLPLWITELDVGAQIPDQAQHLETLLREVYAHPGIDGIVMWAGMRENGCYRMCLTDENFKNLPAGDVVDKIIKEWRHEGLVGTTSEDGYFKTSLFFGTYEAQVTNSVGKLSKPQKFKVSSKSKSVIKVQFKISIS